MIKEYLPVREEFTIEILFTLHKIYIAEAMLTKLLL